jgi:hypothetical protein
MANEATDASVADDAPAKVGVLLVHGIGQQERGDTLLGFGEPLYKWMNAWANRDPFPDTRGDNNVKLKETSLLRPPRESRDAPPSMHMDLSWNEGESASKAALGDPDHTVRFLFAESWWAKDFRQADFRQLFLWGVAFAPWLFHRYAARRIERARAGGAGGAISLGFVGAVAVALLTAVASFAFQVAMLLLLVLALVPALRGWVAAMQTRLAGQFGDAYLLATSPVRFDAMVSQVQADVRWLAEEEKCGQIAVIAHSQGAVVAHEALREGNPTEVCRFLTFGNAFAKLRLIRQALPKQDTFMWRAVVGYAGVVLVLVGLGWEWLRLPGGYGPASLLAIVAGLALFLLVNLLPFPTPEDAELEAKHLDLPPCEGAAGRIWLDFYATADPVPDGPLPGGQAPADATAAADPPAAGAGTWSRRATVNVRNRDSVFADHGAYWQNAEQFVAPVAQALVELAGERFLPKPGDDEVLRQASRLRESRVAALRWAGWLAVAAVPIAVWGLWRAPLEGLVRWVVAVAQPLLGWVGDLFDVEVPTEGPVAPWIGAGLIVLGALAYRTAVLDPLWRRWDLRMAEQLFAREWKGWRAWRMVEFSVAAAAPPAAALIAAAVARSSWVLAIAAGVVLVLAAWPVGVRPFREAARETGDDPGPEPGRAGDQRREPAAEAGT